MNEEDRDPRDHWLLWLVRIVLALIFIFLIFLFVSRIDERASRHKAEWEDQKPRMTQSIPSPPRVSKED